MEYMSQFLLFVQLLVSQLWQFRYMTDITKRSFFTTVFSPVLPQFHGGGEVQKKSSDTEILKKKISEALQKSLDSCGEDCSGCVHPVQLRTAQGAEQ